MTWQSSANMLLSNNVKRLAQKIPSLCFFLLFALVAVAPTPALALPTPDALISVANILPLVTGAIVTALGGVYYGIRRMLGPQASGVIIGGIFGGFIVVVGLIVMLGYTWNEHQRMQRVNNIAMYLRCDIGAHEAFLRWNKGNKGAKQEWRKYGNFEKISLNAAAKKLAHQPDATLIATPQRSIQYYSGVPGVKVNGKLKLFEFVREKELLAYLNQVHSKDLYLHDFYRNYKRSPDKFAKDLSKLNVFKKFEHVYITTSSGAKNRYVVEADGSIRKADPKNGAIAWPVRNEPWIIDGKRASFPHMLTLLPDDEAADYLADPDVYLVAPYNTFHRDSYIEIQTYLQRLLVGISPKRVLILDMNAANISNTLQRLAAKLDGKKFMVIGLTKYDWVYDGLDVSFEMWERLKHDTQRFQLLGFTTRLPEVSAIRWEAQSTKGMTDMLRKPVWQAIAWMSKVLHIPTGLAIILFAIGLRLLFFPIGTLEARSRLMRAQVKQHPKPIWRSSEKTLLKHLGVRSGWELLGTMVMLILILPAYNILHQVPAQMLAQPFLWLKGLDQPDVILSVVVALMIYSKMIISGSTIKRHTLGLLTVLIAVVLSYLPSSLLLYVFGVLLVTTLQEFLALQYSQKQLKRALLKA